MLRRSPPPVLLSVVLAAVLTGCSLNGPITDAATGAAQQPSTSGSAAATPSGPLKIGIASREIVNDYNRDIVAGARKVSPIKGLTSSRRTPAVMRHSTPTTSRT